MSSLLLRPSLVVAALVATALSLNAYEADACSQQCLEPIIAPGAAGFMPASAPGILVSQSSPTGFELHDPAGALVQGTFKKDPTGRTYFAPAAALAMGQHTVQLNTVCGVGDSAAPRELSFVVTAAKPLPTGSGTLTVKKAFREMSDATTSSGSCQEEVDAGMVDFALDVDASAKPYLDVLSWETRVDGKFWSRSEGQVAEPGSYAHSLLRLFTPCDTTGTNGRHPGLKPGDHDVAVSAVLVGGATIIPAKIRVKVTCGSDNGQVLPQAVPDPQKPVTTPTPGGGRTAAPPPAPPPNPYEDAANPSSSAEGCSTTNRRGASTLPFVSALVALGAIAFLRRRSRRATSPSST
jgi:hypothetical protein